MKDKYFGDEHDFRKYGLLQFLRGGKSAGWSWSIYINWMRTKFEPDRKNQDGNKRHYDQLRSNAVSIFDALQPYNVPNAQRGVTQFHQLGILSQDTGTYEKYVPDVDDIIDKPALLQERKCWFDIFAEKAKKFDLVFFDPDNGIEVKSARYGTKNSYKYLYLREIEEIYSRGQNILIYQHKARQSLEDFVAAKTSLLKTHCEPLVFQAGSGVVFFLLLQDAQLARVIKDAFVSMRYSKDYLRIL